jgi:hypothetical protein
MGQMKTAEKWYHEYPGTLFWAKDEGLVQAIQLDAFKAGAKWAARDCNVNSYPKTGTTFEYFKAFDDGTIAKRKAILTATAKLKELPKV